MENKDTILQKEDLGNCPCCNKEVYSNQLYVAVSENNTYHLSCYNMRDSK